MHTQFKSPRLDTHKDYLSKEHTSTAAAEQHSKGHTSTALQHCSTAALQHSPPQHSSTKPAQQHSSTAARQHCNNTTRTAAPLHRRWRRHCDTTTLQLSTTAQQHPTSNEAQHTQRSRSATEAHTDWHGGIVDFTLSLGQGRGACLLGSQPFPWEKGGGVSCSIYRGRYYAARRSPLRGKAGKPFSVSTGRIGASLGISRSCK